MKRLTILLISAFMTTVAVLAEAPFEIIYLNCPSVTIDGKTKKTGDTFSPAGKIRWPKGRRTVMKVRDTESLRQAVIASDMDRQKSNGIMKRLLDSRHLSSREGLDNDWLLMLRLRLSEPQYLIDSISIPTGLQTDTDHFFYLVYNLNGDSINKMLPSGDGDIVIDYSIFTVDGEARRPADIIADLYYYDAAKEESTLLCEDVKIYPAEQ